MIQISGLRKQYQVSEIEVLRGVNLTISEGDFVTLIGRSGCGKTTLLNIIAGLDGDYHGAVEVAGLRLDSLDDGALSAYRRRTVGMVFQAYHLLDHLSCAENVALAARFEPNSTGDENTRANEALDLVGLANAADRNPNRLSGGERQRVAIARALFNRPRLVLLDEPTGNLDTVTAAEILDLLARLHEAHGLTILAATHDGAIETAGRRRLRMADGGLLDDDEDLS